MGAVIGEVADILVEDERRVFLVVDQDPVRALLAGAAHEPFGVAVRPRYSGGIVTVVMFSAAKTASELVVNVVSRSWMRTRNDSTRSPRIISGEELEGEQPGYLGTRERSPRCSARPAA